MSPQVGAQAPEFTLPSVPDGELSLGAALREAKYVIVAFYPKDNTSG